MLGIGLRTIRLNKGLMVAAGRVLSVVGPSSTFPWNLDDDGPLSLTTPGVYTITTSGTVTTSVKMWGAGGSGGRKYSTAPANYLNGGGGGAAVGELDFTAGQTYTLIVGSGGTSTRNVNAILAGAFGFGGNGFAGNSYHAGSGGGLSGIFSGTNITSASGANAILVAGGGGGAGASAYGSIQRSVATSGGGSTVVSVRSTYATGTVVVSAPTSSAGGWGASGMRGGNAFNPGTNIDGRGGGGGGYRGGGAVQTAVTSGATVNTAAAGTGGIGFADPNLVRNFTLYSGGQTLTTYYVPGLNTDADRGGAGNGGSESAVTLSPGNGANGKIILS